MTPEEELEVLVTAVEGFVSMESAYQLETTEVCQKVRIALVNIDQADAIQSHLKETGLVSRQDVLSLESLCPEAISPRYPVNSYTMAPTTTNLSIAMEDASTGKILTFGAVVVAIIAAGIKLIKWIIELINATKGTGEYSATQAAQSSTISKTMVEVKRMLNTDATLNSSAFDQNELTKLRQEVFLDQFQQATSLGFVKYFILGEEQTVKFYSTAAGLISKRPGGLLERLERSIQFTTSGVDAFLAKARSDSSVLDMTPIGTPPEPLLPFVSLSERLGFEALPQHVEASAFPRPFKDFVPIVKADYDNWLSGPAMQLIQQTNTPFASVKDAENIDSPMLFVEWYDQAKARDELERRTIEMIKAISIPNSVTKQLNAVSSRYEELKKVLDRLQEQAKKDANAALSVRSYLGILNTYHLEIAFISNMISTLRRLELDLGRFHRYLTLGETACIRYINSVLDKTQQQSVAKVIEARRKDHQNVVRRFKAYVPD